LCFAPKIYHKAYQKETPAVYLWGELLLSSEEMREYKKWHRHPLEKWEQLRTDSYREPDFTKRNNEKGFFGEDIEKAIND